MKQNSKHLIPNSHIQRNQFHSFRRTGSYPYRRFWSITNLPIRRSTTWPAPALWNWRTSRWKWFFRVYLLAGRCTRNIRCRNRGWTRGRQPCLRGNLLSEWRERLYANEILEPQDGSYYEFEIRAPFPSDVTGDALDLSTSWHTACI